MRKKQLIVNADDFGRTAEINQGIEIAFRNGILSSTSVAASAPAFVSGLEILRRNPGLGVGIHLTINEYPPIHDHPFLHRLTGKGHSGLLLTLDRASASELEALEKDLRLQVDFVRSHGIEPTHIDGHGHCHMQPKLVPIVARIARHYGIRWARMPSEAIFYPGRPSRLVQKCLLNLLCRRGARVMSGDLRFADRFFGFSDGGNLGLPSLNRILGRVSPGLNELMCHVGTGHDDPPYHIGYNWSRELETLTHYTKQQLLTSFGIEVVSYREAT